MPIPEPKSEETKQVFLSRCMSDQTMKEDFKDTKQRISVCLSKANQNSDILDSVQTNLLASNCAWNDEWDEFTWETECTEVFDEENNTIAAEKGGKKVTLNKPFRTPDGPKKFSVYVKNDKGNVVKVNFGDPNMRIKKNIPARRKSFRARHNCDNPGPKWKSRYWACKSW